MEIFDFIDYQTMDEYIKKSDIIITHGGTGSIITPLQMGKKVIGCARLSKFDEHIDDHQMQIVDLFSEEGYIIKLDDDNDIDDILASIDKFNPKKFNSNTDKFIETLKKHI